MADVQIRMAEVGDAEELLGIYRYYVEETAISFEYEVPTVEVFRQRIENTLKKYPYLAAVSNGEIKGYVYASPFVGRAAYDWCAETSIYLKRDEKKKGYGRMLYEALEEMLARQNILNVNACIAYTENEEEHLTNNSMQFHEHMGYKPVGIFHKCGYKFDKWYDMIWMEKMIGEHRVPAKPFVPITKVI